MTVHREQNMKKEDHQDATIRLEYGPIEKTMTLLKPLKNTYLLTPYEQFFIQAFHKSGRLVSKQNPGEPNPLLQMAINPAHPPT